MASDPREAVTAYFDGFEFPAEHCPRRRQAPRAEDALLAVLDLHKPFQYQPSGFEVAYTACPTCSAGGDMLQPYPCDTVQAITTELEGKS